MAELAHFKNFAKLKDTSVEFNDITVLAGKPGTGKSYVMKFMYARYQALSSSLLEYKNFELSINLLKPLILNNNLEKEKVLELLRQENFFDDFHNFSVNYNEKFLFEFKNLLNSIFNDLNQISNNFSFLFSSKQFSYDNSKIKKFSLKTIKHKKNIFKEKSKKDIEKNFEELKYFRFGENIIFVETPLILEFKKFMDRRKGKTPYHIESLLNILDTDYSFTDEEQDKFIQNFREKSQKIIGGDIESSGDSFIFNRKDDKNYDILNASSGIKSIGLLQYLVTNKALKKGSVLFWEEPEVHLHPEWQLRMIELFLELMNAGVKIVFSTHSPYMADYLNAISKKQNISDRVSFNLFQEEDGVVTNYILKEQKDWNKIQTELLDPLEEIMWEYV